MKNLAFFILLSCSPIFCFSQVVGQLDKSSVDQLQFENITVFRIQVRITTDLGSNMDSDRPAWIKLSNKDDVFYLSKGIDNFQSGHSDLYDIISRNIKQLKDIDFIQIGQTGGRQDVWGIKQIELWVNGNANPLFEKRFNVPLRINSNVMLPDFVTIANKEQLRASPGWKLTTKNRSIKSIPSVLPAEYLKSIAEASMGDYISRNNNDLGWSSHHYNNAVNTKFSDSNTIQLEYFLEAKVSYQRNPDVHVTVNMNFECLNQRMLISISDSRVTVDESALQTIIPDWAEGLTEILGKGLRKTLDYSPLSYVPGNNDPISWIASSLYQYSFNTASVDMPLSSSECNKIEVLRNGGLRLKTLGMRSQTIKVQ